MKVVIVEDELAASDNLTYLLQVVDADIKVVEVLDSVKSAVAYFKKPYDAELIFMDIHLADGISFEIFENVNITTPIIFTTAYDQYALRAFKVNSIDYLLKPIDEDELMDAIDKLKNHVKEPLIAENQIKGLLSLISKKAKNYKTTFLVGHRDQLIPLKVTDIAYFKIDTGVVKGVALSGQSYVVDGKLEEIEEELDPEKFYRVNRQFIIRKDVIENINYYFNGKLIVNVNPVSDERIVVSKAKATEFKNWVNS